MPTVSGPAAATNLAVKGGFATWTNNEPLAANIYLDSANDSRFTTNLVSEVLPAGATSYTVSVAGTYYRIRTVNASGTAVSSAVQDSGDGR
jgi:hypothetical protein